MIEWLKIENYKIYENETFKFIKNNLIIGENDSGKTTILESIDILFNKTSIDKRFIKNKELGVVFTVKLNTNEVFYKSFKNDGKLDKTKSSNSFNNDFVIIKVDANFNDVNKVLADILINEIKLNKNESIINDLNMIMQKTFNEIISSIDKKLMIFNENNTETDLQLLFSWDKSFSITNKQIDSVPIDGRGLGYQKNLLVAILCSRIKSKLIILIDEIENSLSLNNIEKLLNKLCQNSNQIFVTTHNNRVFEVSMGMNFNKILRTTDNDQNETLELLNRLDSKKEGNFILLEGKTDVVYINKILNSNNMLGKFIIIPCGGSSNIKNVKESLTQYYGSEKSFLSIYDGDQKGKINETEDVIILEKKQIEYYCDENLIKSALGTNYNSESYKNQTLKFSDNHKSKLLTLVLDNDDQLKKLSDEILAKITRHIKSDSN